MLVIATGVYTITGELAAVIYTELVQTFVLIGGAVTLTVVGLSELGGIRALQQGVPESFFHMFKPISDPNFPWTGIVFGAPILGIWYWCTDQYIVQRVLSAKGLSHAQSGTIFAGFLKFCRYSFSSCPASLLALFIPESPVTRLTRRWSRASCLWD